MKYEIDSLDDIDDGLKEHYEQNVILQDIGTMMNRMSENSWDYRNLNEKLSSIVGCHVQTRKTI